MAEIPAPLPGYFTVNDIEYRVKTLGHTPFCHLCRKRVPSIVVMRPLEDNNPLYVCHDCMVERTQGFSNL